MLFLGGMAGLLTALPSPGATPYLPTVGPVPLRFAVPPAPGAVESWKARLLAKNMVSPPETNAAATVAAAPVIAPADTNDSPTVPTVPFDLTDTNSETAPDASLFPGSLGDAFDLGTPQTWADFFTPAPGGKSAPARTEQPRFIPPAPKSAKESQATSKPH